MTREEIEKRMDELARRITKIEAVWMRKPRSGKTGFVVWHHAKGYDCRRGGNEIRWL